MSEESAWYTTSEMTKQNKKLEKYLKQLHDSFPYFLKETWRLNPSETTLPEPHWVQYDMANWLQYGPKRRGIRGTRGISKTWITCAYILWRLFRNNMEKILLCSSTPANSEKSMLMIRLWMEHIPFLSHLLPRKDDKWRDSAKMLDVGTIIASRDPSIAAMGILGALPGTRASLIVPDDIETDQNTFTREARNKLWKFSEEFEHILLPDGDIVYLGTDHHEESVYERKEEAGYAFRSWPIAYPTPDEAAKIPGLAPSLSKKLETREVSPGDPIWPERFTAEHIAKEKMVSVNTFAMQCMLIRGLADEEIYPLKLRTLMVMHIDRNVAPSVIVWGTRNSSGSTACEEIPSPGFGNDQFYAPVMIGNEFKKFAGTRAYLDPAGSGKDEMAWAIVSQLHGMLFAKHVDGVKGGATQANLERIVLSLRQHDARELTIETNFGGEFLIPLIKPVITQFSLKEKENDQFPNGWSCAVIGDHSSGQKELRIIDRLKGVMNGHRLVMAPHVAEDTILTYQLTRITTERNCLRHEDRIEALSGAVYTWKDYLDQDQDSMNERMRLEEAEKLLKEYNIPFEGDNLNFMPHRRA